MVPKIILNNGSDLDDLSSGEKQRIYAINSLIYHLYNLNSVSAQDNLVIPENDKLAKDYDRMFSISAIYSAQVDIVEELMHKQQVYTKHYNKALINDFKSLFPD